MVRLGPGTLAVVNSLDAERLLSLFCTKVRNFYADVATTHLEDAGESSRFFAPERSCL